MPTICLAQPNPRTRAERWQAEIAASKDACDAGKLDECVNYGNLYADGKSGLAVDKVRAREIFIDACNRGSAMGCLNAGRFFTDGYGPSVDNLQAAKYYKKACSMNERRSAPVGNLAIINVRLGCIDLKEMLKKHPDLSTKLDDSSAE